MGMGSCPDEATGFELSLLGVEHQKEGRRREYGCFEHNLALCGAYRIDIFRKNMEAALPPLYFVRAFAPVF